MEYDIESILEMYEDDYTPAIGPRAMVGEITNEQTQFGRPIYQTPSGEKVSEKSTTLFFNGNWINVPSIHGGKSFNENELRLMIKQGNIEPTSVHKSKDDAEAAAKARSDSMVQGPRNMKLAQVPRSEMDNFNTPDLEQSPDSFLRPGETLEDFDVEFRRPNAQGGRIPFGDGSITPVRNKSKNVVGEKLRLFNQDKLYHLRLGADKKNYYGTKEQLEKIFKNRETSGGTKIDTKSKAYKKAIPNGYGTKEDLLAKMKKKGIYVSDNSYAPSIAKNFNIKTKKHPMHNNYSIYDLTKLDKPKFVLNIKEQQKLGGALPDFRPSLTKNEIAAARNQAIEESGGIKKGGPFEGTKGTHKGHAGNIFGNEKITGDKIIYTPKKINTEMSRPSKDPNKETRFTNLDNKIRTVTEEIENIKKSNMSPNQKKIELEKKDTKLIRLASQADGYKVVTLSDGNEFRLPGKSLKTIDPMDIFPGKTEVEIRNFIKNADPNNFDDQLKIKLFKENLPAENKKLKSKILSQLEKLGCGKSAGGRIMFGEGTSCAIKGKKVLEEGLKNGFKKSDVGLAQKILGSGKFLKDMVSLRGLFGPAALALTALTEAGFVASDAISGGKSFREAIGDSAFNYLLGDKTKINSEEEFIKRLKNIPGSPSQGFRGVTDEDIGKMQYFKSIMNDIQTGSKNYNTIKDLEKKIEDNTLNQQVPEFSDQAFQLNTQLDKAQAENQDYFRTDKTGQIQNYFKPKEDGTIPAVQGAEALQKATLMAEQDQLNDAYRSSPKGLESLKKEKRDIAYELYKMNNPTKPTGYEDAVPSEMSYIMSKIKNEPNNNYGLFGPAKLMEGGIASLNVNKK